MLCNSQTARAHFTINHIEACTQNAWNQREKSHIRAQSAQCLFQPSFAGMEQKVVSPLADLSQEIAKPSSVITQDTRAWLWFRTYILSDPTLRLSLQADRDAHTGAASLLRWCADHGMYPSATFSRRERQQQSHHAQRRKVDAFAVKVLSFAAVICSPDAAFEVKETSSSGLGLFALREFVLVKGQQLPGLTGWRRSLGDAQPTASLNSWMSNSVASKAVDALIGPLSLGNHRCESDLEWAQPRSNSCNKSKGKSKSNKTHQGAVVLRAKAGKTVQLAAGTEIRWNYGQIDFECKCPDDHVHISRKRKRMMDPESLLPASTHDAASSAADDHGAVVVAPAAKRPRTRSQTVGHA